MRLVWEFNRHVQVRVANHLCVPLIFCRCVLCSDFQAMLQHPDYWHLHVISFCSTVEA
ncbi:hypothetical protein SISNIDRAFT_458588 [Sistotremastrum niveocremeum HHB9708]|uniref:Uncharacterized protein n=1 Tax=Sistotremastrum niveocremeum HHB9708 TaxID=1314777 RepID=A0A164QGH7_9AGAM|nr:hypothetical protein SISNIDRAFT_458588 [Sistotremastrum niveocremeum HHB9708]